MSLILAFVMILSGCSGNSDKPSDPISNIKEMESMLSNTVEPRKTDGYNTFEYIAPGSVVPGDEPAWRVTFKLPYDMFGKFYVNDVGSYYYFDHSVSICEKLTYTESEKYYFTVRVKRADADYMTELIEMNEEYKGYVDGYDYTVYDNGVVVHDEVIGEWITAERYFDCGCVVTVDGIFEDTYIDFAYQLLSDAEVSVVDPQKPSFKQISGEEAKFGTPSKDYYGYNFTCKDWREGEQYKINFSLPKGIKYEWYDYSMSENAPDVCGIRLYDATGYSKDGHAFQSVRIDFFDSSEHDFLNSDKHTDCGDGVYYYTSDLEGSDSVNGTKEVYYRRVNKDYLAHAEVYFYEDSALGDQGFCEREKTLICNLLKSIRVSKN